MLPSKESTFSILERRFLNWSLDLMSHDNHNSQREKFYFWRCVVLMTVSFTVLFCITQGFTSNHETVCVSTHRRLVVPDPTKDEDYECFELLEKFAKSVEHSFRTCLSCYGHYIKKGCQKCHEGKVLKSLASYHTIDEIVTKVKDMNTDPELNDDLLLKQCAERAYVFDQRRGYEWKTWKCDAHFLASSYKAKFVEKSGKKDIEDKLKWCKNTNPKNFGNSDTRAPDKDDDPFRRKPSTTKDPESYWQGS